MQHSGTRHLVLATDEQLKLLIKAKTWHVDDTFKVVKQPFTQLFSVHVFVKDRQSKQLSLAFIVMPQHRKDNKRVLRTHRHTPKTPASTSSCGRL